MPIAVLRGNNLDIKLRLVFQWNLRWNHLLMTRCYPLSKRSNIPIQMSSQFLKPLFYDFWGIFTIWGWGVTTMHLPHGFTPTNTCPTKNFNSSFFRIWCVWGSCKISYQQKICLGYVASKPWGWQMSIGHLWTNSTKSTWEHTPLFKLIQNITNSIQSKLSIWHDIANLNMNKRSNWKRAAFWKEAISLLLD